MSYVQPDLIAWWFKGYYYRELQLSQCVQLGFLTQDQQRLRRCAQQVENLTAVRPRIHLAAVREEGDRPDAADRFEESHVEPALQDVEQPAQVDPGPDGGGVRPISHATRRRTLRHCAGAGR